MRSEAPNRLPPVPASPRLEPDTLPADDRGFLLGDGLFETLRVYSGHPFRLREHLERLGAGAALLGIELPPRLEERVLGFLAKGSADAALRITVARGRTSALSGEGAGPPTVAMRLVPLGAWGSSQAELVAALQGRVDERALTVGVKGIGYLERIVALRRARAAGADEALLRNSRGEVVEGSASNVVALTSTGEVVSPGPEEGALPGITRSIVLEEARRMGLTVEERGVATGELAELRELLLTSSVREIAVVTHVGEAAIGTGQPGPLAARLRGAFWEVVRRETKTGTASSSPPPSRG